MSEIRALAAKQAHGKLEPFSYDPGPLGDEQVEIDVQYCGVCHSDLSMLNNEWGISKYPFVPGHIGTVRAVGPTPRTLPSARPSGLSLERRELYQVQALPGRRSQYVPDTGTDHLAWRGTARSHTRALSMDLGHADFSRRGPRLAGPLLCGGITVFNPLVQYDVSPTHKVGVVGIGGLGHMALQFANKWGCDVTAFTSSANKADEARKMGAHHIVDTHSKDGLAAVASTFDFILSTVNANLDWPAYLGALAPKGHLHIVGVTPEPIGVPAFPLIAAQRSVGGSPSGSPSTVARMLDFCARHGVKPITEEFPMSKANEALARLESGKARYRIVLKNDIKLR